MSAIISIVIVNYNAGDLLYSCVASAFNCPLEVEIIIVDNASTDSSLVSLANFSNIQIIRNSRNLGFAAACNIGLRICSADNILFLNPDCIFSPGTLTTLLSALRSDARIGMVGALLTNLDGTEQAGARRAIPTPWRSFVRAFGLARFAHRWPRLFFDFHLHKQPLPEHIIEVEAISGACMLVKREAVQNVGEWDDGYFLHCEDLDWCMRFRQNSWKILFVPSAKISHAQGVCSRNRKLFVEWHKHKGMVRFYKKFFLHQYPGGLMLLVTIGVWLRFVLIALFLLFKKVSQLLGFSRD
jgi:GT2 family glycosyltransferase